MEMHIKEDFSKFITQVFTIPQKKSSLDMLSVLLPLVQLWQYVVRWVNMATTRIEQWCRSESNTHYPGEINFVHVFFDLDTFDF